MGKLAKQKFNAAASKNYREERNQRESQSQQKQQPQPVASKKSTPTTKPHKKQQPSVKVARPTGLAKATAVHPAKNNNMKKNKPPHPKKPNHSRVKSVFGPIATKKLPPSPPNVSSSSPSPSSLKKKKSNSSNSNSSNRGPQDCDHAPMSHPTHLYSKQQQQQQPKAKSNQSNNPHATTQTSNNATKRRKNAATARPATTKVTSVFENRKRKLLHLDESDEDDDFFRDFSPEIVLVARRNYQKQQQQQQQHAAAVQKPTKKKRARSIDLSFPKRTLQQQRPETTKAGKRGPLVSVRDSSHSSSTATRWNPKLPPLDTSPFLTTENMPWTMHGKPEKLLAALPTAATGAPVGSSSSFPSTMLQALDDELMAFHAYVQLTDVEQEARQNFVAHVQQLARDLFSSSVPSPRISSTIECQVFGSFAALDICSFRSDVDVALWGVVGGGPVPPRGATRRRDDESDPSRPGRVLLQARDICNKSQPHNNINNSVVQEAATPTQTIMPELDVALTAKRSNTTAAAAATATAQRRLKWQLALAAIDDANANTNGHHGDNETSDQSEVRDAAPVEYDCAKPLGQSDATKSIPFTNVSTMAMAVLPPVTTSDVAIDDEAAFFFIDRKGDTDATFLTMLEHDTNENENGRKVDILDNTVATENGESAHCEVESRSETIAVFPGLPLLKVDSFQDGDKSLTLVTSSGDEIDDADDDESGDDADPLESLLCEVTRQARLTNTDFITTKDAVEKLNEIAFDSGSAASSDDDTILDDNLDSCSVDSSSAMNVSFVAGPLSAHRGRNAAQSAGPQGRVRDAVIRALASMKNKLNKSKLTRKALLIKARVPIIKIDTCFGFEADIAIGGQTGTDTSLYAVTQIEKYQSFSSVVLFLKVLLSHQSLDEPFSGGLGSYKLYALVAFHLQLHLASGGADSPGEVLLSFLFRFGCCGANRQSDITNQTQLYQHRLVESPDGTSIDLSNVFKLQECVKLFEVCWKRIWDRVDSAGRNNAISRTINPINMQSLLALLVCPNRLRLEREAAVLAVGDWREKISVLNERQKSMAERQKSKEKHQKLIAKKKKYILRQREKFAGGVTSRLRSSGPLSKQTVGSSQVSLERNLKDLTTAELMAGYGVESAIDLTSP